MLLFSVYKEFGGTTTPRLSDEHKIRLILPRRNLKVAVLTTLHWNQNKRLRLLPRRLQNLCPQRLLRRIQVLTTAVKRTHHLMILSKKDEGDEFHQCIKVLSDKVGFILR